MRAGQFERLVHVFDAFALERPRRNGTVFAERMHERLASDYQRGDGDRPGPFDCGLARRSRGRLPRRHFPPGEGGQIVEDARHEADVELADGPRLSAAVENGKELLERLSHRLESQQPRPRAEGVEASPELVA